MGVPALSLGVPARTLWAWQRFGLCVARANCWQENDEVILDEGCIMDDQLPKICGADANLDINDTDHIFLKKVGHSLKK